MGLLEQKSLYLITLFAIKRFHLCQFNRFKSVKYKRLRVVNITGQI